jgi:hypothetical protein
MREGNSRDRPSGSSSPEAGVKEVGRLDAVLAEAEESLGQSGTIETDARVALTTAQLQLAQWIYIERLRRQEAVHAETAKKPESSRWVCDYHSSRNR